MTLHNKNTNPPVKRKKTKIRTHIKSNAQNNLLSHNSVLKALYQPLEQAGIALVPIIVELTQDDDNKLLTMTLSFVNTKNCDNKAIAHYIGHSDGLKDTLTLILEF